MIWIGLLLLVVVALAIAESEKPKLTVLTKDYWSGIERQPPGAG